MMEESFDLKKMKEEERNNTVFSDDQMCFPSSLVSPFILS
jgi:hypothetical protein